MNKQLFVTIGSVLFLTAACGKIETNSIPPNVEATPQRLPQVGLPVVARATLGAVGDILIHSSIYSDAHREDGAYQFAPMFAGVQRFMLSPDILVANQESMIGGGRMDENDAGYA